MLRLKSKISFLGYFSGIALLVIVSGCINNVKTISKSRDTDSLSVFIDIDKISNISLLDIFKKVEVIPLETGKNSIIKEISKIICYGNHYYILDSYQNAVFVFDTLGHFELKLQKVGNGPGEYSLLYDININSYSNEIELLNPRGELLIYSLAGEFRGSILIPIKSTERFTIISEDIIVFYSLFEKKKLFYFSRKLNNIINEEFEFPGIILNTPLISTGSSPFNKCDSVISFFQGFSNDIYEIDSSSIKFRFRWDFGDHNFNYRDLPAGENLEFYASYLKSINKVHSFNYLIENKRYILTRFIYNKLWNTLVFDKIKNDYMIVRRFNENVVPPANPVFFNNGIIANIDPMQTQILVNESVLGVRYQTIINKLKPEDNPILIKYYFND
jgi:hypothetical protein